MQITIKWAERMCALCGEPGAVNSETAQHHGQWLCVYCEEEVLAEEAGHDFEGFQSEILEV